MDPIVTVSRTRKAWFLKWIGSVLFSVGAISCSYFWTHQGGAVYGIAALILAIIGFSISLTQNQRGLPFNTTTKMATGVSFPIDKDTDSGKIHEIERAAEVKLQELMMKYQTNDINDPRIKAELSEYLRTTFGK